MNHYYNQMADDINAVANTMVTQMICAEKGIDYNQLMQTAQQAHINNLIEQERQKQIHQLMRNHYQGRDNTFFGKLKNAFGGTDYSLLTNQNPIMPAPGAHPGEVANFLGGVQQSAPNFGGVNNQSAPEHGNFPSEAELMQQLMKAFSENNMKAETQE